MPTSGLYVNRKSAIKKIAKPGAVSPTPGALRNDHCTENYDVTLTIKYSSHEVDI